MARISFFIISALSLSAILLFHPAQSQLLWALLLWIPYTVLGCCDVFSKHNILRNYPVIGHLRYWLERLRPEIRQYFISDDLNERPFSRQSRTLIYQRAKNIATTEPFGTECNITQPGYLSAQHSLAAKTVATSEMRVSVGNKQCLQPYNASRLHISAMSFGALSGNAVRALNRGAKQGDFAHNTGEGGISPYHRQEGGDLIWQIGTGYFGCRDDAGKFCQQAYADNATNQQVKMIELKLSQGAKPSHGGLLPAAKITAQIASIRGIARDKDCISPATHSAFANPLQLMHFIHKLKTLSGGKPVGFKLCLGAKHEFMAICKAMLNTQIIPDFITIDGAEGGTGAAPIEFSNRLGTSLQEALPFIHHALIGCGLRSQIKIIVSGKIASSFDMLAALAQGADICAMARPMLFSLGCIQARRCHTNRCPTGITTQNKARARGIVVADKYQRVSHFHAATIDGLRQLVGAIGCQTIADVTPWHIYRQDEEGRSIALAEDASIPSAGAFVRGALPELWREAWYSASADSFAMVGESVLSSAAATTTKDKLAGAISHAE